MSKRFRSRRANGRFTPSTLANTFGLAVEVCPRCRSLNPHGVGEPKPERCHACDALIETPAAPFPSFGPTPDGFRPVEGRGR